MFLNTPVSFLFDQLLLAGDTRDPQPQCVLTLRFAHHCLGPLHVPRRPSLRAGPPTKQVPSCQEKKSMCAIPDTNLMNCRRGDTGVKAHCVRLDLRRQWHSESTERECQNGDFYVDVTRVFRKRPILTQKILTTGTPKYKYHTTRTQSVVVVQGQPYTLGEPDRVVNRQQKCHQGRRHFCVSRCSV